MTTKGQWVVAYRGSVGHIKVISPELAPRTPTVFRYDLPHHAPSISEQESLANAYLVTSAINACQEINSDNPLAVAVSIPEMYKMVKRMAAFLYSYSGDEKTVSSEWYRKFKELYTEGYAVLAEMEGALSSTYQTVETCPECSTLLTQYEAEGKPWNVCPSCGYCYSDTYEYTHADD